MYTGHRKIPANPNHQKGLTKFFRIKENAPAFSFPAKEASPEHVSLDACIGMGRSAVAKHVGAPEQARLLTPLSACLSRCVCPEQGSVSQSRRTVN